MDRAGVPGLVAGPALAAYGAARHLRVEGALGWPWMPTNGILPGCALAVFILRVLLVPWEAALDAEEQEVVKRAYVDDVTFWRRGPRQPWRPMSRARAGTDPE
eukprot:11209095-Lingulodinium_polyedra.AAC.1